MRLVVDGQSLQSSSRFRGIGRYTGALIRAIAERPDAPEIVLALNGRMPEPIDPIARFFESVLPRDAIRVWDSPGPIRVRDAEHEWRQRTAEVVREAFIASLAPDIVLVPALFEGYVDDAATSIGLAEGGAPVVVVCHDIIPQLFPDQYLPDPTTRAWYGEKLDQLNRADLVLTISQATRTDLVSTVGLAPDTVVDISAAVDSELIGNGPLAPERRRALAKRYGLDGPFVMFTGGGDPRKNADALIRAYAGLPRPIRVAHRLAIVHQIDPARKQELVELTRALGLAPNDVVVTGYVPDADLRDLYRMCEAFVFPSTYEGFGLPILEAMGNGRAVIGSRSSSISEVIGRDDALFDPGSETSIRDKLVQVLTDDAFRGELERYGIERCKRYSWTTTAERALSAISDLPRRKPRAAAPAPISAQSISGEPKPSRPRLALVLPAPLDAVILTDTALLLPALARHYDIEVVADAEAVVDSSLPAGYGRRDVAEFRADPQAFDRVLYRIGAAAARHDVLGLLQEFPGVVDLWGFSLAEELMQLVRSGAEPGAWSRGLYRSHGYSALVERHCPREGSGDPTRYPCNLDVLEASLALVVHSEHERSLVRTWYGARPIEGVHVVPKARDVGAPEDKAAARAALGVPKDAFLVYHPGPASGAEIDHRLFAAWRAFSLAGRDDARLLLVGTAGDEADAARLSTTVESAGLSESVRVAAGLARDANRGHLAAADIGIVLDQPTGAEIAADALDCLGAGLPTIVTAAGALAELPVDAVLRLDTGFSDTDLAAALDRLSEDADLRARIGTAGQAFVAAIHMPDRCADRLVEAIEAAHRWDTGHPAPLVRRLAELGPSPDPADYVPLADALSRSFPPRFGPRQLMLDISILVRRDARSGIQRVVRAILMHLLATPPEGCRVEPVYADDLGRYRYARKFTQRFLGCPDADLEDSPIEGYRGDRFLMLDLHHNSVNHQQIFQDLRLAGVKVWAVVYDLLPVHLPDCFMPDVVRLHPLWLEMVAGFDGAACISGAVADELTAWIAANVPDRLPHCTVRPFHLGADIGASVPTRGLPPDAATILAKLSARPTFLMVGTVEPRKGHAQVLGAFEAMWRAGRDVNLVIVGVEGWRVRHLVGQLRHHAERGERLFWLEGATDEFLDALYARASCLVAASRGEGFGLPLIEAARHGLPVLARDIPVFREVGGAHASYFRSSTPEELAEAIERWLDDWGAGRTPSSADMRWLSWAESTQQLCRLLFDPTADRRDDGSTIAAPGQGERPARMRVA